MTWAFATKSVLRGDGKVGATAIVDQEGAQVLIVTVKHHQEVAEWLVRLMNRDGQPIS